jgi:hypothetical protein
LKKVFRKRNSGDYNYKNCPFFPEEELERWRMQLWQLPPLEGPSARRPLSYSFPPFFQIWDPNKDDRLKICSGIAVQ